MAITVDVMRVLLFPIAILVAARAALASEPDVDYLRDVKPILQERCWACHGPLKQEGGLRLDTAALLLRGGDSGPATITTDATKSLIIEAVTGAKDDWRMPPEGEPLTPTQIALLRQWVDNGASAPAEEQPQPDPREHWAYRAPVRPELPTPRDDDWSRNPIDTFIAAEHDARKLEAVPLADRSTLIRRLFLDLIGLPPSSKELERWTTSPSPDWYEQLVEELLAHPAHGQRQA